MQTQPSFLQEEAEGATTGVAAVNTPEPLIQGQGPILWAGVGAFLIIFITVLMLIIRGRVVRPSRRKAKMKPPNYFEPAGDDADITFDDEAHHATESAAYHEDPAQEDEPEEAEISIGHDEEYDDQYDERHRGDLNEEPEEAREETPKKKKSAFAGLFSKKPDEKTLHEEAFDNEEIDEDFREEAPVDTFFADPEPEPAPAPPPHEQDLPPELDYAPAAAPAADATRLAHAEDVAQRALQRAEDAEKLARDLARANTNAERTVALGLKENEAALNAMSERLTALAKEFQTRLETVPMQAANANIHDAHDGLSEAHFAEFADLLGEQFETLRNAVNASIDRLSQRIDHLPAAAPHAVAPTAARVQLSDILSDALPAQRYEFGRKLTSGRTADACIDMPGSLAPIAVDARFPVEAFDAWQRARNDQDAETELRRIILRHIADAGEKLIVRGETADCAMMFVPSEHILSQLHTHFPDLVQESYRAKVWMVAPTSLMATLHTISAVISGAGMQHQPSDAASSEIARELKALRERIASLEAAQGRGLTEQGHAKSYDWQSLPEEQAESRADIVEEHPHAPAEPASRPLSGAASENDKSPFPLR
jgi:DNA recombination protein RmuC